MPRLTWAIRILAALLGLFLLVIPTETMAAIATSGGRVTLAATAGSMETCDTQNACTVTLTPLWLLATMITTASGALALAGAYRKRAPERALAAAALAAALAWLPLAALYVQTAAGASAIIVWKRIALAALLFVSAGLILLGAATYLRERAQSEKEASPTAETA